MKTQNGNNTQLDFSNFSQEVLGIQDLLNIRGGGPNGTGEPGASGGTDLDPDI